MRSSRWVDVVEKEKEKKHNRESHFSMTMLRAIYNVLWEAVAPEQVFVLPSSSLMYEREFKIPS